MKDILFEKGERYKSNLKPAEIEVQLLHLIKRKDGVDDSFTGKVYPLKFRLAPVLGARQNFKIVMYGTVKEEADTGVEIVYTVSSILKLVVYGLFIAALIIFLLCRLLHFDFRFREVTHVDYYILGAATIFLIHCKFVFAEQYIYYSKFITRLLDLKTT